MVFLFMAYATALMVVLRVPVSRLLAAGAGRSSILGALFYMPFYAVVNGIFGGVICTFASHLRAPAFTRPLTPVRSRL